MSKPKTPKTPCERCGRKAAGGGQRYCWRCLFEILDSNKYYPPAGPQRKRKPGKPK